MYSSSRKCVLAGLVAMLVAGTITVASEAAQREPEKPAPASRVGTDLYGDPLPAGAVARLGTVRLRRRSDHYLYGMAFLPDNNTLLTADGERAQFWDAKTGRLLREISVEPLSIRSFGMSADAKHFAVAGLGPAERAEIRVLETASGKTVQILPRPTFRDIEPARLAFSPDGKLLFSLGWSGILRVEEIASGKERRQREFPKDSVQGLVVSADGKSLVIASGPNTRKLFLWKWEDQEPQLLKDAERVEGISFSPDGKLLACVSLFPNRLHMLEIPSGRLVYRRDFPDKERFYIRAPLFTPDGKTLLVPLHRPDSSDRWQTELFDAKTGDSKGSLPGGSVAMTVSPNSQLLATGAGQALRIWDLTRLQDLTRRDGGHSTAPMKILGSRLGFIVTAGGGGAFGSDNTVCIWDAVTTKQERVIRFDAWVRDMALSKDDKLLAASCFDDTLRLIAVKDAREVYRLPGHGKVGSGRGAALAFAPDGSLVSWGDDLYLRRWDMKSGRALLEHRLRPGGVPEGDAMFRDMHRSMAAILADARTVVMDLAGHYHFFDVATGKEKQKLAHGNSSSSSLAISPNGKYLLATYWARSGQQTHTVLLHNLTSDSQMNIMLPGTVAGPVAFSPDSRSFATSTHASDEIRIFETATGQERRRIRGVPGRVWSLAFLHDGRRIASGMSDSTVLIWDLTAPVKD